MRTSIKVWNLEFFYWNLNPTDWNLEFKKFLIYFLEAAIITFATASGCEINTT